MGKERFEMKVAARLRGFVLKFVLMYFVLGRFYLSGTPSFFPLTVYVNKDRKKGLRQAQLPNSATHASVVVGLKEGFMSQPAYGPIWHWKKGRRPRYKGKTV